MSALEDLDLTTADTWALPPCDHADVGHNLEYKIHLNELVCICGARRRLFGEDQRWHRTNRAIDARPSRF